MNKASARSQPYYTLKEKLRQLYNLYPISEDNYSMLFKHVRVSYSLNHRTFSIKQGKVGLAYFDIYELAQFDENYETLCSMIAGLVYANELKNWSQLK